MPDHDAIYRTDAERYDALIDREDYESRLPEAMRAIRDEAGLDVADLGAGTGRLTRLLARRARHVWAFDAAGAMLDRCHDHLAAEGTIGKVSLALADHRSAPMPDGSVDLLVSGWSVAYDVCRPTFERDRLDFVLARWNRMLRDDGTILIIETQGTGAEVPTPPERLVPYYAALAEAGFDTTWIRTDYRFASLAEAEALCRFFFGDALADRVRDEKLVILPECTGLWWRHGRTAAGAPPTR
jgi:ubiquinone/menaquinone biosynthesis C-methylase UbiE